MLLAIDVGNTNVVLGVFKKTQLAGEWRITTNPGMTKDELGMFVSYMLSSRNLLPEGISKIVVSCVVTAMTSLIEGVCNQFFNCSPYWVDAQSLGAMPNKYENPKELGSDRVVNVVAGYEKYKTSLIVIDLGTATTFDAVAANGTYLGGAISPGLTTAANGLFQNAPRLPREALSGTPKKVIGTSTLESLQSGIIFGYAGLVDGMVNKIKSEMKEPPKVIATGGLSHLMKDVSRTIECIEPDLTLQGLRVIGSRV